jgi:hypothetical protein
MDDTQQIWFSASLKAGHTVYLPKANPAPEQPGTDLEQHWVIDCYLADPTRHYDPDGAWEAARKLNIEHARRRRP